MRLLESKTTRREASPDRHDAGLLVMRLVTGGLMAGHGAQKLFGWFGGHGLQGTGGFLETLGFRPGPRWASLVGASEFGGGLLTVFGLFHPLGELLMIGPMTVATAKVHWGKAIWTSEGGAEGPVLYTAAALGLALAGPGRVSLDRLLGIKVPRFVVALTAIGVVAGTGFAILRQPSRSTAEDATEVVESNTEET